MDITIDVENNNEGTHSPRSQALIESLQAQLSQLQETNFELQASLATVQAEQSFSIQQLEAKYKEENTTLQNALRLQQQTTQRLLQQQQQQNKRPRNEMDPFQRRLPTSREESVPMTTTAAIAPTTNAPPTPEPPREIMIDNERQGTTFVDPKPSPQPISTNSTNQLSDAKRLAQNLLHHVPSQEASPKIHNFLLQVAMSDRDAWTECTLVEFLLQQPNALWYWQPALLWSRAARQGILHAMEQLETDNPIPSAAAAPNPRSCRIHRLNPDRSLGEPVSTDPPLVTMNPQIVQDWVGNRLDRHNPHHLRLLALILEDCPSHTTNVWWRFLLPGITLQLIHLHAQMTNRKTHQNTTATATDPQPLTGRRSTTTKQQRLSDLGPSRRLRFQSLSPYTATAQADDLWLACLTLMERLIAVTRVETLEAWYSSTQGAPKQPSAMEDLAEAAEESALLWVGLVLDVVEGLECFQYHQPLVLPGWYLQVIEFLGTMGQTKGGMKVLRTRVRDSSAGDHLPNALETAIVQLFHLSLMDSHDAIDYLDPAHQQRLQVMNGWVRLLHQALLLVQQQETPVITFRSLVEELYEHYTCACTRILTDTFANPDIHTMIRLQLDELAMDDEEHEEWKE